MTSVSRKYQEELRAQIEKFELYKLEFESQNLVRIEMLEEENRGLKADKEESEVRKEGEIRKYREREEKLRQNEHELESEVELLKQRLQFVSQSAEDGRKSHQENAERWEQKLRMQEENLRAEMEHKVNQVLQEKEIESAELER